MFFTGEGTFSSDLVATLVALTLLALPFALGLGAGTLVAKSPLSRRLRLASLIALALALAALSLAIASRSDRLSLWEPLFATLLALVGAALCAFAPAGRRLRTVARLTAGLLLGALVAELGLRAAGGPTEHLPPPHQARLFAEVTNRDPPCNVIFPASTRLGPSEARGLPVVLHLGDSMVAGAGVTHEERFVSQLAARQPDAHHVNLAAVSAGPDVYLLAMRRWIPALRPARVVVYLFVGNDLFDLDVRYLCCASGGLLLDASDAPRARCETPSWKIPLKMLLATSPPPFSLRVLASSSRVAALALSLSLRAQNALSLRGFANLSGTLSPSAMRPRWPLFAARLRAMQREAQRAGVPLTFVVLPHRQTVEHSLGITPSGGNPLWSDLTAARAGHERFVSLARETGAGVLDAWSLVRDDLQREGPGGVFAEAYPGDVHFSAAEHARIAAWLDASLTRYGGTTTQRAPPTQLSPGAQH